MDVWDVVLCHQHVKSIGTYDYRSLSGEPIWAPLRNTDEHSEAYYAHMWLTKMLYLEYDITH